MPGDSASSWSNMDMNNIEMDENSTSDRSDKSIVSYSSASAVSTSTSISRFTTRQQQIIEDESLAVRDSEHLTKLRFFLITILFWSTVGVGLAVWIYFTEDIENKFDDLYHDDSLEVLQELESRFIVALGAIDSFMVALCTLSSSEWPFVTAPHFSVRAQKLRKMSHAFAVTTYPYVEDSQREEWEEYSSANDNWLEEDLKKQEDEKGIILQKNVLYGREPTDEFVQKTIGNTSGFMVRTGASECMKRCFMFVNF